jgi:hypothetical protein
MRPVVPAIRYSRGALRREFVVIGVALGLAAGGCKKLKEKLSEQREPAPAEEDEVGSGSGAAPVEEPIPVVVPDGPGLPPGKYKLIDVVVQVRPTNGKRERWDDRTGPDPDLKVVISVDEDEVARCSSKDSVTAVCHPRKEIEITAATQIAMDVVDVDAIVDDPIGGAVLSNPSRWGAGMDLPLQPSGRVLAARIRFERVPTWWELNRGRMIGLAVGIGGALLVLGVFRRGLLVKDPEPPPPAPPPPPPRCSHCDALVVRGALACHHCGAKL